MIGLSILLSSYNHNLTLVQSFSLNSFPGSRSKQTSYHQTFLENEIIYQNKGAITKSKKSSFGSHIMIKPGRDSRKLFQNFNDQNIKISFTSLFSSPMNSDTDNGEGNEENTEPSTTSTTEEQEEVTESATEENSIEKDKEGEDKVEKDTPKSEKQVDTVLNSIAFLTKKCESLEAQIKTKNESINQMTAQFEDLEVEWGASISSMRDDFENLKDRYLNDTLQYSADGKIKVFTEMITTLEDLERAERMNKAKEENEKLIEKEYKDIADKMIEVMKKMGVEEVETVGKEFNYEYHDALFTEPSDEYPEEYITKELAKGFLLNGKCIRAAKVATSEGPGP